MRDLLEEIIRIPVGTRSIDAHLFRPTGTDRSPGILFLMELYGIRSWLLADARDCSNRRGNGGVTAVVAEPAISFLKRSI